jgi:hypothetical protein
MKYITTRMIHRFIVSEFPDRKKITSLPFKECDDEWWVGNHEDKSSRGVIFKEGGFYRAGVKLKSGGINGWIAGETFVSGKRFKDGIKAMDRADEIAKKISDNFYSKK